VSDPNSPAAAANGQYILVTREAYDAVGGHAAIATDLLEDVALARARQAIRPQDILSLRAVTLCVLACIAAFPSFAKAGRRIS